MLISRNAQARQCWYPVIYRQLKFWFNNSSRHRKDFHLGNNEKFISRNM